MTKNIISKLITPSFGGSWKGAFSLIRSEKLYSAMYICGTALAIAFTMLIAEVYYVKTADIAPEVNRSKTYYLDVLRMKDGSGRGSVIPPSLFRDMFQKMQTPECMTAVMSFYTGDADYMILPDGIHDRQVKVKMTESGFFRFFQFRFTEGAPFTQDDFDNGRRTVVITEDIRNVLFGKEGKAVGSTVTFRHHDYRICGVVETPSELTEKCVADIYVPYAADGLLQEHSFNSYEDGCVDVYFSVPTAKRKAFMQEIKEVEARYNAMHTDMQVDMTTDLESHHATVWKNLGYVLYAWGDSIVWYVLTGVLLLLVVPAVNLSGMVASRMERRLQERAIRKAFGAKRRTLLWQVIVENLLLTLIGGLWGLCLAWLMLYCWRDWVFAIFATNAEMYADVPVLKGEMFFGPAVFLIALIVCCTLNVLAATLPAWMSLRKPIVESMMIKK